jgi:hypothetical protein
MPMMASAAVAPPVAGPAAAVFDRLSSAVVPHLSLLHLPCNSIPQPRIPLQCFGLPSASPASPMTMPTMLPAPSMPSLMLSQQGLDPRLSVMLAQANYSSLSQQYDNMQAVRYLQHQQQEKQQQQLQQQLLLLQQTNDQQLLQHQHQSIEFLRQQQHMSFASLIQQQQGQQRNILRQQLHDQQQQQQLLAESLGGALISSERDLGHPFSAPFSPPIMGHLQQPTSASYFAANAFGHPT